MRTIKEALEDVSLSLEDEIDYADMTEEEYKKEIERLNNIINELEHDFESYELEYLQETYQGSLADFIETELKRIQELKKEVIKSERINW